MWLQVLFQLNLAMHEDLFLMAVELLKCISFPKQSGNSQVETMKSGVQNSISACLYEKVCIRDYLSQLVNEKYNLAKRRVNKNYRDMCSLLPALTSTMKRLPLTIRNTRHYKLAWILILVWRQSCNLRQSDIIYLLNLPIFLPEASIWPTL